MVDETIGCKEKIHSVDNRMTGWYLAIFFFISAQMIMMFIASSTSIHLQTGLGYSSSKTYLSGMGTGKEKKPFSEDIRRLLLKKMR